MKGYRTIAVVLLGLALGACSSSDLVGKLPKVIGKLPTVNVGGKPGVAAVQQAAINACSFLPTPGTAGALLLAVSPTAGLAEILGQAICDTVRTMPPAPLTAAKSPQLFVQPVLHGVI